MKIKEKGSSWLPQLLRGFKIETHLEAAVGSILFPSSLVDFFCSNAMCQERFFVYLLHICEFSHQRCSIIDCLEHFPGLLYHFSKNFGSKFTKQQAPYHRLFAIPTDNLGNFVPHQFAHINLQKNERVAGYYG